MTKIEPVQVTRRQNDYLVALEEGPKVTRDFILAFGVTGQSVGKILNTLRALGLVVSSAGHIPQHNLIRSYPELVAEGLEIRNRKFACHNIPYEELEHAAKLRNAGLVGQRLIDAYRIQFPDISAGGVRYRVTKARERRLF